MNEGGENLSRSVLPSKRHEYSWQNKKLLSNKGLWTNHIFPEVNRDVEGTGDTTRI